MSGAASQKVEVTREDQQNINAFNRLNARMHEVEGYLKAKKKILEDLEDASNELMLSDEENIRYVIGECFVHVDKDHADERLEKLTETVNADIEELNNELESIKDRMKQLKVALYGKFGSSINLEE